jgi:hypothetical protein
MILKKFLKLKNLPILLAYFFISFVVVHQVLVNPVIGIANNGDFGRFMRVIGVDYKIDYKTEVLSRRKFVIKNFRITDKIETKFDSTAEMIGNTAVYINNIFKEDTFSIKFMGLANVIFYLVAIGLLALALGLQDTKYILLFSILGIPLLTNREIIHYFNSFYYESSSIIYFLMFLAFTIIYLNEKIINKKYSFILIILQIITAFLFVNAKIQNILFIFPITAFLLIEIYNFLKRLNISKVGRISVSILSSCILVLIPPFYYFSKSVEVTDNITSYNIIMGGILGASNKPERHLQAMGFNEVEIGEAMQYIGMNLWGKDKNLYEQHLGVFNRKTELKILFNEPRLIFVLINDISKSLFEPLPYGNFIKGENNSEKVFTNTVSNLLNKIKSFYPRNFVFFFGVVISLIGVLVYKFIKNPPKKVNVDIFILALVFGELLMFFTAVFGDFCASIKHLFFVNILFDILLIALIIYIYEEIIKPFFVKKLKIKFLN